MAQHSREKSTYHKSEIGALRQTLAEFSSARGWEPFHTPKNLASALSVEAAELLEIFQWLSAEESVSVMEAETTAEKVREEVADIFAYLLQFCNVLDIDLASALSAKIQRNEKRFPRPTNSIISGHAK